MSQPTQQPISKITLSILIALSLSHCLNDLLQAVVSATYPLLKEQLSLSFAQIGLITLVYQLSASVFQPITGYLFDKRPFPWSLPTGMTFTLIGLINFAFANTMTWTLCAVFLIGLGSSILHPEASRIAFLASGGKRGLAQSLFQVGGNLGGSLAPLLVALIVAPYGKEHVAYFVLFAIAAIIAMLPICRWYKGHLNYLKTTKKTHAHLIPRPLSDGKTLLSISILLILIFSKYIYMASLTNYYTFYLIHKFGVTIQQSQLYLFIFLAATAIGTLVGGPLGDRIGRKYVIWISILGTAPFSLLMPHVGLLPTIVLSFFVGFMLSSAFPAILLYAQELLPNKLGLISGLFFGLAFGIAGIASAVLGSLADQYGIEAIYNWCAFMPLLGLFTWFLPDLKKIVQN